MDLCAPPSASQDGFLIGQSDAFVSVYRDTYLESNLLIGPTYITITLLNGNSIFLLICFKELGFCSTAQFSDFTESLKVRIMN